MKRYLPLRLLRSKAVWVVLACLLLVGGGSLYAYTVLSVPQGPAQVIDPEVPATLTADSETVVDSGSMSGEHSPACEKLLSGSALEQNVPLPITCAFRTAPQEPQLALTITTTGRLEIRRGREVTFTLGTPSESVDSDAGTIDAIDDYSKDTRSLIPWTGLLSLQDLTYDGYADLYVTSIRGAYQSSHAIFAYNPAADSFVAKALLDDVIDGMDLQKREIYVSARGRGPGDTFTAATYRFMNGQYVLVYRARQDIIDFMTPGSDYVYTVEELRNGVLTEVKREIIPYEEVWGEEE